jgi:quercetin dioxygenase-like cupin family protein
MSPPDIDAFKAAALADGFDEVLVREWEPNQVVDLHSHPFAVSARVVRGELWLTVAEATRHLQAGDTFSLEKSVPHTERYGAQGATFWVARAH